VPIILSVLSVFLFFYWACFTRSLLFAGNQIFLYFGFRGGRSSFWSCYNTWFFSSLVFNIIIIRYKIFSL